MQRACLPFRRTLQRPARGAWGNVTIRVDKHSDIPTSHDRLCKALPSLLVLSSWLGARRNGLDPPPPPFSLTHTPRSAPEACTSSTHVGFLPPRRLKTDVNVRNFCFIAIQVCVDMRVMSSAGIELVTATEWHGYALLRANYRTAAAVLHVVAGAIPNTQLGLVLPVLRITDEEDGDKINILSPPLLPQLQSRLIHLSMSFDTLVSRLLEFSFWVNVSL